VDVVRLSTFYVSSYAGWLSKISSAAMMQETRKKERKKKKEKKAIRGRATEDPLRLAGGRSYPPSHEAAMIYLDPPR
jgi:hypothetical protein